MSNRVRVKRQRDYKTEYQRRIKRAEEKGYSKAVARGHAPKGIAGLRAADFLGIKPGSDLGTGNVYRAVSRDAKRTFGDKPKREKGESPEDYAQKLAELQLQPGRLQWTDEAAFVQSLLNLGLTAQDAYTHWFSP